MPYIYPVFCIPAAIPFMVMMRVSSRPGGNSVVWFNETSSAEAVAEDLGVVG